MFNLKRHSLGFWELSTKPTVEELQAFYTSNYFDSQNFERKYDPDEFFHKFHSYREAEYVSGLKTGRVLDIGFGEGFSLEYFKSKGWDVVGFDFSDHGIKRQFPDLAESLKKNIVVGDLLQSLKNSVARGEKFDLLIVNNVLEHLLDPIGFLNLAYQCLNEDGLCRVQVPNDDSILHQSLFSKNLAPEKFWYAPHEHMSYFNSASLAASFKHCGFKKIEILGDFPIDMFCFNSDSNYLLDRTKGKNCHRARIDFENLLVRQSVGHLVAFRRGLGQAEVGRNTICYGQRVSS